MHTPFDSSILILKVSYKNSHWGTPKKWSRMWQTGETPASPVGLASQSRARLLYNAQHASPCHVPSGKARCPSLGNHFWAPPIRMSCACVCTYVQISTSRKPRNTAVHNVYPRHKEAAFLFAFFLHFLNEKNIIKIKEGLVSISAFLFTPKIQQVFL